MATRVNTTASRESNLKRKIQDYKLLLKFRLSLLAVFSAAITYLLGVETLNWGSFALISIGGFCLSGAASTLNQVLEKEYDKVMSRTSKRPLASGRMEVTEAVLIAGLLSVIGILMLAAFNPLSAMLGAVSLVSYAFIYTPMKRVSPIAVWIGAVPGALPMAIGWVAATGELDAIAIALFGIQFFWQFPHFWAIAWLAYEDYAKAGFFLLPSRKKDGRDKNTALQCIFYALILIPVGITPWLLGITGITSAIVMTIVAIPYLWYSIKLYTDCNAIAARKLMFSSFLYLPVALIIMLIDKV